MFAPLPPPLPPPPPQRHLTRTSPRGRAEGPHDSRPWARTTSVFVLRHARVILRGVWDETAELISRLARQNPPSGAWRSGIGGHIVQDSPNLFTDAAARWDLGTGSRHQKQGGTRSCPDSEPHLLTSSGTALRCPTLTLATTHHSGLTCSLPQGMPAPSARPHVEGHASGSEPPNTGP